MKIAKIALLLILSILILTVMTGCRCVPSSEKWYLYSYKATMTFIGGVTRELGFADASVVYPFAAVENQEIGISFSKDGKVEFTPRNGITVYGTYTYEHQGMNYTSFTITLENGEIIEGDSFKNMSSKKLALTYQGIIYNFTEENNRSYITMDTVIQRIRNGETDSLHSVNVYKDGEKYSVRFSEYVTYPIKEDTAVYAVHIKADGSYEILNEIREGEALSTYNNNADYVVIYYVD